MSNFKNDILKLIKNVLDLEEDSGQYSEKTLDSAIKTSRAIKCFKNTKDCSYYVSRFKSFDLDKRDFIRIIIEIPIRNNLKSKNIETILYYMGLLESSLVYFDKIKYYTGDGLIHLDVYRENKFPENFIKKE